MNVNELLQQIQTLQKENKRLVTKTEDLQQRLTESDALKDSLEAEVEILMRRITQLTRRLAEATRTDQQLALSLEIKRIQQLLEDRNTAIFGSKSERRSSGKVRAKPERKKRKGHGPRKQPNLPRTEQLHLLDEADQCCPHCGAELRAWGERCEESEEITVVKRRYELVTHKRQKYKCSGCDHIESALGPRRFFPGNRYSTDFAIAVAIDKYCDHLPLNRQVGRMRRAGLEVTTSTLWDQLKALYVLFLPTLIALHEQILQSPLVYADETTWRVMEKGGSKKWWVWAVRDERCAYYLLAQSRSQAAGRELLQNYDGIVMADDFSVYGALEKEKDRSGGEQIRLLPDGSEVVLATPNYTLSTCWSHIRRYFVKAEQGGEEDASFALERIGGLYGVEREASVGAPAELLSRRRRLRSERSAPLIAELNRWRNAVRPAVGSRLEKAVSHLNRVWERATLFLENPVIPLDNNAAERSLRGVVVGRRNHQGSRSEEGCRVSALFYSLTTSCELLGVNPSAYLAAAVTRILADRKTPFLPTDFKACLEAKAEVSS